MTQDLFDAAASRDTSGAPLADRMRPQSLDEMVGQDKILGTGRALRLLVASGELPSMILWGPPGSGKTTLARLLAKEARATLESVSAVMSGVKELREIVERASERRKYHRQRTLLFVDEIHRFNKAQQDALLPHVETGMVTLIGATTENPSFEVISALLSRCKVFVLEPLGVEALCAMLTRAVDDPRGLAGRVQASPEVLAAIASASHGDGRSALNTLEVAAELCRRGNERALTITHVEEAAQQKTLLYDKAGDEHYNVVSAFIKSLRGSDPDAAVYWMARMLEAGEDPLFVIRRMVIFASEDIGNADPRALTVAVSAMHAFELMGLPEGVLPLTQAATYLASAPKSNAVITAYGEARKDVRERGALPVPLKLRNAPTRLMHDLGYARDYHYPHNDPGHHVAEHYLPDALASRIYYKPSDQGEEVAIGERLARWRGGTAMNKFETALAAFDAANAEDPHKVLVDGKPVGRELVQAQRLAAWVERLDSEASEPLRLAARCQHLRRWEIARDKFPAGRAGYLKWRSTLAVFHAERAGEILSSVGYDAATIARVRDINLKKHLKKGDADTQTMEDALCLAFLQHELEEFAAKQPPEKVADILKKTWGKMSERGHAEALRLELPPALGDLMEKALG